MMRWQLAELIGRHKAKTGESITYKDITDETGISKTTLSAIARNAAVRADLETVDRILGFMSDKLGEVLTTQDLLKYEVKPK